MKKYLIVANWKNYPDSLKEAKKNFEIIKSQKIPKSKPEIILCPSILHLSDLVKNYRGKNIQFGAQNFFPFQDESCTGEISMMQIKDLGIKHVIVGHAERRTFGETNEMVAKKLKNSISFGLRPILCIGEHERDKSGSYLRFLEEQLIESINLLDEKELKKIVIAYEPLWAIGTNTPVRPSDIHVINILIKKVLSSIYGRKDAFKVKILYGGSVDPENCQEIIKGGDIDGLLIGRASINPYSFNQIIKKINDL